MDLKTHLKTNSTAIGFCYWGGEWVSFKGSTATNGSSWENQALWDFTGKALPAIEVFD
jgi:arabinogalactan endo-1,4-beta-galactosidase